MSALPAFRIVACEDDLPQAPPPGPELEELLQKYCRLHPALSDDAADQYQAHVNLALRWLRESGRPTLCDELFQRDRLCDFFKWLCAGRAPATVNGRIDTLWMLWSFATDENPALCAEPLPPLKYKPRAKEPKKDPVAFTIDQIVQLIAAALRAPAMRKCSWWSADHWVTLIATYLATAERFTALLLCPRSALQGSVFMVPAELTKDGKENPVVIPDWIAEKIRRLPSAITDADLIWPYPYGFDQLRRRYTADILVPAKLPISRWHKFHCLRRSAVTQVKISEGLEKAREMARHFGQGLTLEKYVSQRVVQEQTGSVSFNVPAPSSQLKLW
jgi:integrase